ncbi:MAG: tryptophan-rich sensory protein [Negativicutes bacterium]|nr:tryptophan-rich sensory protein [Negativicutes bacterium]
MGLSQITKLFISLAASFITATIGGFFTSASVTTWYPALIKPAGTPPAWLFGPVWFLLYFLMAIALFLIWRTPNKKPQVTFALQVYFVHLLVNILWSAVFFGLQFPFFGLLVIFALWVMIGILIFLFFLINKEASFLMVPYWLWVTYAMYLNFGIWRLN